MSDKPVVLSKLDVLLICDALDLKIKSYERAARNSSGGIAKAYERGADELTALVNRIRNQELAL